MPQASHLRAIPVAQMYKAIHGQKASSELIPLSIGLLRFARNDEKYKRFIHSLY
jgi:hypothetical protein